MMIDVIDLRRLGDFKLENDSPTAPPGFAISNPSPTTRLHN